MIKILIADDQQGWRNFNTQAVYDILGKDIEVVTAASAQEGYSLLLENNSSPFDIILTDMQMEDDYAPRMAGEWLIEQAKNLPAYLNTKIVIISASMQSKYIAEHYGVDYLPKSTAIHSLEAYKTVLEG